MWFIEGDIRQEEMLVFSQRLAMEVKGQSVHTTTVSTIAVIAVVAIIGVSGAVDAFLLQSSEHLAVEGRDLAIDSGLTCGSS